MLRSANDMRGLRIQALNGEIGRVDDFFFDDAEWTIRYLVADTGGWMSGRRVLLSPWSLRAPDWDRGALPVDLTKDMIAHSPDVSSDEPVSRQIEKRLSDYYGWPVYWTPTVTTMGTLASGSPPPPPAPTLGPRIDPNAMRQNAGDPHLRSMREVTGYHIQARDGAIGHVEDFLVDDQTWRVRYVVVDTRNWLPGRKVLVSPPWIGQVRWDESKVHVDLDRETIRNSPEYRPNELVDRDYEERLHTHYGLRGYWEAIDVRTP